MARLRSSHPASRTIALVLATAGLAAGLGACGGGNSAALGHEACVDVAASLRYYGDASHAASPARARADRARALEDLDNALQPAALAASSDGSWQALEATLSESSRVNEGLLTTALDAQCAQTLS